MIALNPQISKMFFKESAMSYQDFMNKVRHWDNLVARWILRHFYLVFFQAVLAIIFVVWLINSLSVIDTRIQSSHAALTEQILMTQSVNLTIIVLLMILNSFWLLYIFNSIQGLRTLLKDIGYGITRLRINKDKHNPPGN